MRGGNKQRFKLRRRDKNSAIEQAARAPYVALSTIDDIYPERPPR